MAIVEPKIKRIQLSDGEHEIDAKYLGGHTYEEIVTGGFHTEVFQTLPTAGADYINTLALVPDNSDPDAPGTYVEHVIVVGGTAQTPTYAWEQIGTTRVDLKGVAKAKYSTTTPYYTTAQADLGSSAVSGSITYSKSPANTGNAGTSGNINTSSAGGATVNGSNFTFSGSDIEYQPAGEISLSGVNAHTHAANVTAADSTAIKNATLGTTTTAPATGNGIVKVVTGQGAFTANVPTAVTLPTFEDVSAAGTATISIGSASGWSAGTNPALTITGTTVATEGIKSYPGAFAKLAQATGYGTGTTTVYGTAAVNNAMTAPTVSSAGVLSWTLATVSNGTSATVSNGTSFTYATGSTVATSATGGAQIMTGLGTAVAAGTTSVGSASGWSAGTRPALTVTSKTVVDGASTNVATVKSMKTAGSVTNGSAASLAAASTANLKVNTTTAGTVSAAGAPTAKTASGTFTGTTATLAVAGSIGGSQTISAHSHTYSTVPQHSHSITVSNATASFSLSAPIGAHSHTLTLLDISE